MSHKGNSTVSKVSIQETLLARAWRMLADIVDEADSKTITPERIRRLADKLDHGCCNPITVQQ
jgi:hypothetical protein